MLAAFYGAGQRAAGLGIAIKTKQPKNSAGAAAHDVKLLVRRNQLIGEKPCCIFRVGQQIVIAEALRDGGEGVDDRAQAGGAADAKRARDARGIAAFQVLAQMGECRERKFAGRLMPGHRGMRGEENGDAAGAVVKVGAETDELKDFGIAEPVEADPGGARTAANGALGYFRGDLIGFGTEQCLG